jgi:F-type H+-transporting ATPase subunit alpha
MPVAEQVAVIYAVSNGHFDAIPVEKIREAEASLLDYVRGSHPEALGMLQEKKELTDEVKKALDQAIEGFTRGFAPAAEGEAAA